MAKRTTPIKREIVRCAIYTRKSTEEGLEQEFNSLDAQREACAAYIVSQRHEGWVAVKDSYDDGGFSGGTMERPGIKPLLADVDAGKVDVIVVHKVDRLTRALSDFARIVEILDARNASFVSITQSFNTTTSMGRLTLNVLLSFAQFEREVTGERIRDKIAASKAKGMWMGGNPPLGYDVCDRKLVVNEAEAATVRHIMERYVALASGRAVLDELRDGPHRTKLHGGRGGLPFRTGGLYHLLANQTYIGKVVHHGTVHEGEHLPIVDMALWERVQALRAEQRCNHKNRTGQPHRSLLVGRIVDGEGRSMTPSHAVKGGRRYRYYVTHLHSLLPDAAPPARIAAHNLEDAVSTRVATMLGDRQMIASLMVQIDAAAFGEALARSGRLIVKLKRFTERYEVVRALVRRVTLNPHGFVIEIDRDGLREALAIQGASEPAEPILLNLHAMRVRQHKDVRLVIGNSNGDGDGSQNAPLVALLAEARLAYDDLIKRPGMTIAQAAQATGRCRKRLARLMRIALLAPDIVERCIAGTQPMHLTTATLFAADLPIAWGDQRRTLQMA